MRPAGESVSHWRQLVLWAHSTSLGEANAVVIGGTLAELKPLCPWCDEADCVLLQQTPGYGQLMTDIVKAEPALSRL